MGPSPWPAKPPSRQPPSKKPPSRKRPLGAELATKIRVEFRCGLFEAGRSMGDMGRVSIRPFRGRAGQGGHGSSCEEKASQKKPPKPCLDTHFGFACRFGLVKRAETIGYQFQPSFGAIESAAPNAPTRSRPPLEATSLEATSLDATDRRTKTKL